MKRLLVYIPTYNRFDLLNEQLNVLCNAIETDGISNVNIVVSDNASTDERYLDLPALHKQEYVLIKRRTVNIGGVANVISGFEIPNWDYIWILSDDDIIKQETLKIVSKEV